MKKIFRGYLCNGDGVTYDDYKVSDTILLVSEDLTCVLGAVSDLLGDAFNDRTVSLRYYISDKPLAKDELQERWLLEIMGEKLSAKFEAGTIYYSELTTESYKHDEVKIGGHDLMNEFRSYIGKFIHLEIETV